jgi:hypothetical protein
LVNYKTNIKGFNFNKTKLKDTIDAYTSEHIILYCDGIPLVQRAYNKTTCLPYVLHYSIQSIRSDSKLFDNFKKTNRLDMELLDLINLDLVL